MSIKSIEISTENWDPLLTYIISSKLDSATIVHYECQLIDVREPQSFVDLLSYIQSAALKSETYYEKKSNEKHNPFDKHNSHHSNDHKQKPMTVTTRCTFCSDQHLGTDQHSIFKCKQFEKKSVQERYDWIKTKKLCLLIVLELTKCKIVKANSNAKRVKGNIIHWYILNQKNRMKKRTLNAQNASSNIFSSAIRPKKGLLTIGSQWSHKMEKKYCYAHSSTKVLRVLLYLRKPFKH